MQAWLAGSGPWTGAPGVFSIQTRVSADRGLDASSFPFTTMRPMLLNIAPNRLISSRRKVVSVGLSMKLYTRALLLLLLFTCLVAATAYTYWTRTPQYALLHALRSQERNKRMMSHAPERGHKRTLTARSEREPLTRYLAAVQNRVLAKGYGVHIQHLADKGHTVVLRLHVNDRDYALTFYEQPDGRWRLEDFPARADLVRDVTATPRHHPFLLLARL